MIGNFKPKRSKRVTCSPDQQMKLFFNQIKESYFLVCKDGKKSDHLSYHLHLMSKGKLILSFACTFPLILACHRLTLMKVFLRHVSCFLGFLPRQGSTCQLITLSTPSKMENNHSDPSMLEENSIPLTVPVIRHVQSHPSMASSPPGPGSRSLGSLNKDLMSHGKQQ